MPTIRLNLGDMRTLTDVERLQYPEFKYVVSADCICHFDDKKIVIPAGFLTDGSTYASENKQN